MNAVNFKRHDIEQKSFLIVDDFGDMRSMLRSMLQGIGVSEIDAAANGKDAVDAIEKQRYDIILCDYNLGPGKNGQQVLEEVRHRNLIGIGSIFVMITAENTREMVMGAVEYEPDSYLTKPFTKDLLRTRLEKLLIRKKDLQDVEQAVGQSDFTRAIGLIDAKIAGRPKNVGELTKLKAELCYRAGDYQQAIEIYESVLAARDMPWARLGLGKTLFALGRLDDALELFEALLQENRGLAAAYDWLARVLQTQQRLRDAQEVLQRAVALSPKAILRQKALGELALKNEDDETAGKALFQAVQLGRNSVYRHPSLHANLARARARGGSTADGLKVLKQMEKEFAGDQQAELYSAMVEGTIQQQMGNPEDARLCLGRASALYQKLGLNAGTELTLEMARTCGQLGDPEQAKAMLQQAVRDNHAEDELLQEVQAICGELKLDVDPDSFIADIRKEIIQTNNRGVELARNGKLQEAAGLFEEAVKALPGNKVVNLNAARVMIMYMQKFGVDGQHLGQVRQFLERVRHQDPENNTLLKLQRLYQQLDLQQS